MPLAQIKVIEGVFDADQKRRIVEGVTDAITRVDAEPLRDKTVVVLEEVASGGWAIGGQTVSTPAVRDLLRHGRA